MKQNNPKTAAARLKKISPLRLTPAIVPGTAFGENGKGFCRACFATSYEQLVEAATRIERHVANVTAKK